MSVTEELPDFLKGFEIVSQPPASVLRKLPASVDVTAEALGVDPQTARHYLDASKAFKGSELMKKFASVLLPQNPPRESQG